MIDAHYKKSKRNPDLVYSTIKPHLTNTGFIPIAGREENEEREELQFVIFDPCANVSKLGANGELITSDEQQQIRFWSHCLGLLPNILQCGGDTTFKQDILDAYHMCSGQTGAPLPNEHCRFKPDGVYVDETPEEELRYDFRDETLYPYAILFTGAGAMYCYDSSMVALVPYGESITDQRMRRFD